MRRRTLVFVQLGLALLTVAVYARVAGFDFAGLDDIGYVLDRPEVLEGPSPAGLVWAFTATAQSNWHPLTWISLMLDARLGGGGPAAFHLTNVLFHVVNTLLLFHLLWRLTGETWKCALVAALFRVHPLHVESVAWIAERKDVLSTCFGFLAMLAYVRYVRRPGAGRYVTILVLFALGLLSKPMLVTLPLVLLLLDFWPLGRLARGGPTTTEHRRVILEKLPMLGLAALSAAATLFAQASGGAVVSLESLTLYGRLANAAVSYVVYMLDTVWPTGLAVPYPYSLELLTAWRFGLSALLLASITVVTVAKARRAGYLFVGWFWFLVTLVPVIGVVQVGGQARADRYTYVPLIGLFIIVAWGGSDLWSRFAPVPAAWRQRLLAGAAVLAVLALAVAGHLQTLHWRDASTLFNRALAVTKDNHVAHYGTGFVLLRAGQAEQALPHFREALRLSPSYFVAQVNIAAALVATGALDEGIRHYRQALELNPGYVPGYVSLGDALLRAGKTQEAMAQYREALRRQSDHTEALRNLGLAHLVLGSESLERGEIDEAARHLGEAARLDPTNVKARRNLGVALAQQGRYAEAVEQLTEALRLDPSHEGTRRNLQRAQSLAATK